MFITKGKIRFQRLKKDDLELVRNWRNHPSITQHMVYREHITKEMQAKWFESVNNNFNLYFVIEYKGKKIGLINGKDINWEEKTMETGIFIWDKYYRKTHIPTLCTMVFAELGVSIWGLKPTATILKNNERALKYNKMLGFKVIEDDADKEYVRLKLEKDSMGFIAKKLKVVLNLLSGDDPIKIIFEKEDIDSGIYDIVQQGLDPAKVERKVIEKDSITYYFS